jgi:hypothetical protein
MRAKRVRNVPGVSSPSYVCFVSSDAMVVAATAQSAVGST